MKTYIDVEDATVEERLHHVELYATANVDSWIEEFAKRIKVLEDKVRTLEALNAILGPLMKGTK